MTAFQSRGLILAGLLIFVGALSDLRWDGLTSVTGSLFWMVVALSMAVESWRRRRSDQPMANKWLLLIVGMAFFQTLEVHLSNVAGNAGWGFWLRVIGLWLAAEKYSKLDFEALDKECLRQAEFLRDAVAKIPGIKTSMEPFDRTRKVRRLVIQWDEKALGFTADQVEKQLWDSNPRIAVQRYSPQGLMLTCFMNDPGDERPAAKRLQEVLKKA